MAIRLTKAWLPIADAVPKLRGNLGVYQLADEHDEVIFIGFAGGRSQFGLKGEVMQAAQQYTEAVSVRVEVNTAYQSRYRELLMVHVADHGELPRLNPPIRLGRLSPA